MKSIRNLYGRILLLILALSIFTGLAACTQPKYKQDLLERVTQRGKIIVGVKYDSKPFGYIDENQKLQGYDIDLVKEIAKRILGNENAVEFQQVTSSSRIISLTSGTIDLVAATMTINEKRKRVIDFSSPYYIAGQALMVSNNSKIRSVKDLNGKNVIVILGSTAEDNIRMLAPNANILGFRTYTDAFSTLRAKRADALTTDDIIIAGLISEDPNYKMLKERYTKEPYGIGFKKGEETKSFQEAVNMALDSMRNDGTLEKLKRKWMPY
ncbi:MAG: hypothetical protein A2287_06050 [Candidatus Melainabacteria bacterium RIFOXYA12_FULL_32_12]|nr:MAG: hypothetical protein A2255_06505 [Candidatus Melainabacteria bacterium RIFOXYA2_FULL_32_9]OGI28936.1 MAG: hypothetical protein A2287_06050 [Candidatus Melainabacteria bacterium RIFOXYA12_FULL_32_12]